MKIKLQYKGNRVEPTEMKAGVSNSIKGVDPPTKIRELAENNIPEERKNKLRRGVTGLAISIFGIGLASQEVITARQIICDSCEFKEENKGGKCGCWLAHKTRVAEESCPMGYWNVTTSITTKNQRSGGCGCGNKDY